MHVQSISHWAPANIGPYSQVVEVGHKKSKKYFNKTSDFEYIVKPNDHPRDPKNWSSYKRCLLDKGW